MAVRKSLRREMMRYASLREWGFILGCSHEHIRDFYESPRKYPILVRRVKTFLKVVHKYIAYSVLKP